MRFILKSPKTEWFQSLIESSVKVESLIRSVFNQPADKATYLVCNIIYHKLNLDDLISPVKHLSFGLAYVKRPTRIHLWRDASPLDFGIGKRAASQ